MIELLVVIAIIGVLSATVLVALNSARQKGNDASVRKTLVGLRNQAELYYEANNRSYLNICGATAVNGIPAFNTSLQMVLNTSPATQLIVAYTTQGGNTRVTCHATANEWAVEAPLYTVTNGMYCVDSTGNATTTIGSTLSGSDAQCGS